jgi:hypothetical protein
MIIGETIIVYGILSNIIVLSLIKKSMFSNNGIAKKVSFCINKNTNIIIENIGKIINSA